MQFLFVLLLFSTRAPSNTASVKGEMKERCLGMREIGVGWGGEGGGEFRLKPHIEVRFK